MADCGHAVWQRVQSFRAGINRQLREGGLDPYVEFKRLGYAYAQNGNVFLVALREGEARKTREPNFRVVNG